MYGLGIETPQGSVCKVLVLTVELFGRGLKAGVLVLRQINVFTLSLSQSNS